MKLIKLLFILLILAIPSFAGEPKNGEELIRTMRQKYDGKWYKTLTFVQKTTTFKPDGTSQVTTWYEAMSVPGRLRIDIDPLDKGNGMMFADSKFHSFRDGKAVSSIAFVHPLMVLGFDIYFQPAETTIAQVKAMGIDLTSLHREKWQGRDVYVLGAKQGDLRSPQVWVDKERLVFVRLIELKGKYKESVHETLFNKYEKTKGGGWIAPEVIFYVDGKLTITEEYSDVQTGVTLSDDLFDPEKWMSVDRTYYKLR
jgi:outer membrane lipoprotein-sorting protein